MGYRGITRVARARAAKGLTQTELGQLADTSARTIRRLENGETRPQLTTAYRIALVLGLSLEDVLGEDEATA